MLAFCIVLPTMFALTACGHKHSFSDDWTSDATNHWHVCTDEDCDETSDSTEHTFVAKKDGTNHWSECSVCGYKKDEAAHNYATTKYDATKHWKECSCGDKKDEEVHTLTSAINGDKHRIYCEDCEYSTGELDHTYETDEQTTCDNCGNERDKATLAFKTGTYTFTYDGNAHAFDKTSLVEVEKANLDEVVVKYSTSKTNPVWTEEAPKNAGKYYVQLSVPATKDHTACTINNLEETSKVLTINRKSVSLDGLVLVCTASEMNTNSNKKTLTLTSKDINGLCGSDTLTATLYKKDVSSGTTFYGEGTEWNIKEISSSTNESTDVGIQADTKGNYIFNNSATGKLYVTKALTVDTEDLTKYTAEATIKKDCLVYYALDVNRTGTVHPESFDVALSDSDAKIEKVYTNVSWLSVTLAADGTLVTYGPAGKTTVYVVVKYVGSDESKNVTLTLTRKTYTSTVSSTEFTNALNLDKVSQYHTTLKEDGTVIEENKIDKKANEYYKKNNNNEVIYAGSSTSIYQYSKTTSATVWTRTLNSYESADAAKTAMYNATKFSSALLAGLTDVNEFTFSNEEQMYKLASKEIGTETYTNIALKFYKSQLVYAEYKKDGKTYSITFEYGDPDIDVPVANYLGYNKDNAIKVPYVRTDGTFKKRDILLTEGNATYLKFTITDEIIKKYANDAVSQCGVQGTFTVTGTSDATITIEAFPYSDTSSLNLNSKKSESGKLLLTALKTGDYYLKITTTATCTGSLSMEKYALTVSS